MILKDLLQKNYSVVKLTTVWNNRNFASAKALLSRNLCGLEKFCRAVRVLEKGRGGIFLLLPKDVYNLVVSDVKISKYHCVWYAE